MTLSAIDQALNVLLTGFIYGSGTWIACAFGAFVVTQRRKKKMSRPVPMLAPATASVVANSVESFELPMKETVLIEDNEEVVPSIEITIEQPLLITMSAQVERAVVEVTEQPAKKVIEEPARQELEDVVVQPLPCTTEIVCEPVDWKRWRVADLRKASIAKVCGVRTRPIGSQRNLRKADLIAQYEQQLKRLTKVPVKRTVATEVVA